MSLRSQQNSSFEDDDIEDVGGRVAPMILKGKQDVANWEAHVLGATSDATFLARAATGKMTMACANDAGRAQATIIARMTQIAKGLYRAVGQLQAQYMRRPNTLVSIYTPVLAPGATVAFSVQPGVGNSYYRIMGLIADDTQCSIMGFTALQVGGQNLVNFSQTTPTAPVPNAVPWAIYQLKEGNGWANVAPWTGQIFDANTPITGTVCNMTVAASGDAITVSARMVILTQTDPCAFRGYLVTQEAQSYFQRIGRFSAGLVLGQNPGSYATPGSNQVF